MLQLFTIEFFLAEAIRFLDEADYENTILVINMTLLLCQGGWRHSSFASDEILVIVAHEAYEKRCRLDQGTMELGFTIEDETFSHLLSERLKIHADRTVAGQSASSSLIWFLDTPDNLIINEQDVKHLRVDCLRNDSESV